MFEKLIRRFNEKNNEEAGEHFTPRDRVRMMAKLLFLPAADQIQSGTYLLYDGSCGTGGMLTVAEEALHELAASHDKQVSIHLFGQEINPETYAICKTDLLLRAKALRRGTSSAAPTSPRCGYLIGAKHIPVLEWARRWSWVLLAVAVLLFVAKASLPTAAAVARVG